MTIEQSNVTTGGGAGGAAKRAVAEGHSSVLPAVLPNTNNLSNKPSQHYVVLLQVGLLAEQPSVRLLKHIVRCYLRLSDNPRAREALRQCLPDLLRSPQFTACLKDDPTTRRCVFCFPSHTLSLKKCYFRRALWACVQLLCALQFVACLEDNPTTWQCVSLTSAFLPAYSRSRGFLPAGVHLLHSTDREPGHSGDTHHSGSLPSAQFHLTRRPQLASRARGGAFCPTTKCS